MRRRELLTLLGGAIAWPTVSRAQPTKQVGIIQAADIPEDVAALEQALRNLGWAQGHNIQINNCRAGDNVARFRACAEELTGIAPDVVVVGNRMALEAVESKSRIIPIIFLQIPDPVETGFVKSESRHGGNVTGFTNFEPSMVGKWLELLRHVFPRLTNAGVLLHASNPTSEQYWRVIDAAAPSLRINLTALRIDNATEIATGIETFARESNRGLIVPPSAASSTNRELIIGLAAKYGMPAIYPYPYFTRAGGLMSYGVDTADLWRRAGAYVDRILKGSNPGDLPIQAPIKFQLIINLKTAKALSLDVPPQLLALVDEAID